MKSRRFRPTFIKLFLWLIAIGLILSACMQEVPTPDATTDLSTQNITLGLVND